MEKSCLCAHSNCLFCMKCLQIMIGFANQLSTEVICGGDKFQWDFYQIWKNISSMERLTLNVGSCRLHLFTFLLLTGLTLNLQANSEVSDSNFLVGVGSYDITGPAADVNMMGYANPTQNAAGVHIRLRARAFIVAEPSNTMDGNRVVFVNIDACMASMAVTLRVLSRLEER